tara:strand:- start:120 stop:374 length:255 start_codon:yes stop_codon:yes gene_type:complete
VFTFRLSGALQVDLFFSQEFLFQGPGRSAMSSEPLRPSDAEAWAEESVLGGLKSKQWVITSVGYHQKVITSLANDIPNVFEKRL